MRFVCLRLVSGIQCAALAVQPVMAIPAPAASPIKPCSAAVVEAAPRATGWMPSSLFPFAIAPLSAVSPVFIEQQRSTIEAQLVNLGFDLGPAQGMAGELTPEDLAVLVANPKMMQKAGDLDAALEVMLWTVIIVGVVVVLIIIADDSTVVVNT